MAGGAGLRGHSSWLWHGVRQATANNYLCLDASARCLELAQWHTCFGMTGCYRGKGLVYVVGIADPLMQSMLSKPPVPLTVEPPVYSHSYRCS